MGGTTARDSYRRGHAIQARVASEDPHADFTPSPGQIKVLALPSGSWVRTDFGFEAGDPSRPSTPCSAR
ncbi:Methylcrotonyl-CoA carboxylase biotin-containing subunit [Hyphomicrobiales bacterium]|nr:Methylcrotonyl-CoA carboxylase biotin-containing subunit [Hyphomicrobiales bacterium]CAH1687897.1 Methylcrotonyl-CoA carboxylase biotin-containing subunit [Hyphomicrobiales bacterium]